MMKTAKTFLESSSSHTSGSVRPTMTTTRTKSSGMMSQNALLRDDDDEDDEYEAESTASFASDRHDKDTTANSKQDEKAFAKRENRSVTWLRRLMMLVLCAATILVACLVYFYTSNSEKVQFETQFREDANKVLQSIGESFELTLGGIDALVVSLVSHARATNQTWPYVTVPNFGVRVEKVRTLTRAVYINVYGFVPSEERHQWEAYSAKHGPAWVEESYDMQERVGLYQDVLEDLNITRGNITYWDVIHDYDEWDKEDAGSVGLDPSDPGPFMPMWQTAPLVPVDPPYNWDYLSVPDNASITTVIDSHLATVSEAYLLVVPGVTDNVTTQEYIDEADWISSYITSGEEPMEPISDLAYPILEGAEDWIDGDPLNHRLGGILSASIYWRDMIKEILPENSDGIIVSFDNPCNPTFSYQIFGPTVEFLGAGDFHESRFEYLKQTASLLDLHEYSFRGQAYTGVPLSEDFCPFSLRVYPSSIMESHYKTRNPAIYTVIAALSFLFCIAVFLLFDFCVERRQRVVLNTAVQSTAIVSELFPSTVRERMYRSQSDTFSGMDTSIRGAAAKRITWKNEDYSGSKRADDDGEGGLTNGGMLDLPIADLFPETTVVFADLAGFTAWSSTRDPTQVFILLETLYGAFDSIAKRRGVFKVETIGDCYVAVSGLPEPRRNHCVVIVRFAAALRNEMREVTRGLEVELGVGTSTLSLRVGVHSGAVTAGVLRNTTRSRFQLFGDTVNTAARMESTGVPDRIHVSQKSADLLFAAGKGGWLTKREEMIEAKGKGKLQTWWAEPAFESEHSFSCCFTESSDASGLFRSEHSSFDFGLGHEAQPERARTHDSLIEWAATTLETSIKDLLARRRASSERTTEEAAPPRSYDAAQPFIVDEGKMVRDEVVETVALAPFTKVDPCVQSGAVELSLEVSHQLRSFVSVVAHGYKGNAFHNFEHACHVTMSTRKLLSRINKRRKTLSQQEFYIHSFGVALDPLAQVAMLFASLVHDLDHPGVNNAQLVREDPFLAARYQGKSVAEQNSIDVAWALLMQQEYADLRSCLFATEDDYHRFRQLAINCVLATDIFDPELRELRNKRWVDAFSDEARSDDPEALNRKATIVIEHVIQASDVSHTMQHWEVYRRWNQSLFEEAFAAYISGREAKNPALMWYNGELWFFDNYIIPLAKKLKECEVFGASSHEFLDNAYENRLEWETKGRAIVEEMVEKFHSAITVDV